MTDTVLLNLSVAKSWGRPFLWRGEIFYHNDGQPERFDQLGRYYRTGHIWHDTPWRRENVKILTITVRRK